MTAPTALQLLFAGLPSGLDLRAPLVLSTSFRVIAGQDARSESLL
jgi:hypothetical protein